MPSFGEQMEPINLKPFLKMVLLLSKSPIHESVLNRLGFTITRAKKILDMLIQIELVSRSGNTFELSSRGQQVLQWIRQRQWLSIDHYLTKHHPAYRRLKDIIIKWYEFGNEKGIPINDVTNFEKRLLEEGYVKETFVKNKVILAFLVDWGERLGGIMENKLSEPSRLYLLAEQKSPERAHVLLKNMYQALAGKGLGEKYYLPIASFREYSCELLRIPRNLFDTILINLYEEKPECVRLFSAPETTISLEGARKIRQIEYQENDVIEVNRSPLYGLKLNNSTFYYVHLEVDKL